MAAAFGDVATVVACSNCGFLRTCDSVRGLYGLTTSLLSAACSLSREREELLARLSWLWLLLWLRLLLNERRRMDAPEEERDRDLLGEERRPRES